MTDVFDLKTVSDRYMGAWFPKDIDTIAEIEAGRGFGHSVAFPRVARGAEQYKESLNSYFGMMDFIKMDIINREIALRTRI